MNFPVYRPHRCRFCGTANSLTEDILIKDDLVVLTWHCTACEAEWQPASDEHLQPERRVGTSDRRRITRGDRRKQ